MQSKSGCRAYTMTMLTNSYDLYQVVNTITLTSIITLLTMTEYFCEMARDDVHTPTYTRHNKVQLIHGGSEYFTLLENLIDAAKSTIHLHTYLYDADETGIRIADALKRAANRNVKVYLLLDGYASGNLPVEFINSMKLAGVHLSFFEPFVRSQNFYMGRRLHYKVFISDAHTALVGGINISNKYNDTPAGKGWLDWAICTEGEAAEQLQHYCIKMWNGSLRRAKIEELPLQAPKLKDICIVKIRRNDWVKRQTEIYQSYMELFHTARHSIILMSSYFWPGRRLLNEIIRASDRGVKIKLILAGPSDVKLAKWAERYVYRRLFRSGIDIYEYQDNILHGKIAVRDGQQVLAGSYNVNNISAYASVEVNLDIKNAPFAREVNASLDSIIEKNCLKITRELYTNHYNFFQRLWHRLSFDIMHIVFFLFTFYFKQTDVRG